MKKFTLISNVAICCLTFLVLYPLHVGLANFLPGETCNDAITENSNQTCVFTTYTTTGLEMWFIFTATSTDVQITLVNQATFGTNAPHAHSIALFDGTCANLNQLEEDELPFLNPAAELTIDASGLIIGNTYYIRVQREANGTVECFQGTCFPVIQPATFDLCIQDIDVFIPLDFNLNNFGFLESPVSSHIYHTNKGQIVDTDGNPRLDIKLYTNATLPAIYFMDTSISIVFANEEEKKLHPFTLRSLDTIGIISDSLHRVDMKLVGGNPTARIFKTEKAPGHLNYFLGHVQTGIKKIKGFNRLVCNNVYPNIDIQYYSNSNGLKYYFIVHPGGNADDIVMRFEGASSVDVTGSGGLRITTSLGNIEFEAGHAYQINPSVPTTINPMPWQAEFMKVSANEVKFDIRNYPKNKPLIIQVDRGHQLGAAGLADNILWCTYYGDYPQDWAYDIVTDENGNVYVTGEARSTNFPTTDGAFQTTSPSAWWDAFLLKFNSAGVREWATIYGGSYVETGYGIATDKLGNVYLTGSTASDDFPLFQSGSAYFDSTMSTGMAFIAKLNQSDGWPTWSTYFGDDVNNNWTRDIAIDQNNDVYIVGSGSNDSTFTFVNPGGGAYFNNTLGIAFLAKFNVSNELVWSTLFPDTTAIEAIAIDNANNVVITGYVNDPDSTKFQIANQGNGYLQSVNGGASDAFVAKFTSTGVLFWSTFFGGIANDRGAGIKFDSDGNIYVVGHTNSDNFPLFNAGGGAYFDSIRNGEDIFIAKFSGNGVQIWTTLYGGNSVDMGMDITVDIQHNVYITGKTESPDFETDSLPDTYFQGQIDNTTGGAQYDAFVLAFDSSLVRKWASFFGGDKTGFPPNFDIGYRLEVFQGSRLYISGLTYSYLPILPIQGPPGAYVKSGGGSWDVFIVQFDLFPMTGIIISGIDAQTSEIKEDILVYPNPIKEKVTFELGQRQEENITIRIFNILGAQVYYEILHKVIKKQIDVSKLSTGMYMIQIKIGDDVINKKIVKQN